jgi:hypothetical protein
VRAREGKRGRPSGAPGFRAVSGFSGESRGGPGSIDSEVQPLSIADQLHALLFRLSVIVLFGKIEQEPGGRRPD